jgi:hypothetical protein
MGAGTVACALANLRSLGYIEVFPSSEVFILCISYDRATQQGQEPQLWSLM